MRERERLPIVEDVKIFGRLNNENAKLAANCVDIFTRMFQKRGK